MESGYLEEFIEDAPLSLFPTIGNSEKPDVVASKLLEGRVAVICDGTPFVLTAPFLFIESLHSPSDHYARSYFSTTIRMIRFLSLLISLTAPSFYVALLTFHQGAIPIQLLMTVTSTREGIPFSPLTEALLMGITFEILQEAGIRMPRPIGQAVSIVGALVIGDAAVNAGLVSSPMVIVTALTAIASFINPPMSSTIPILRVLLLLAANTVGFLGIFLCVVVLGIHMCSVRSFGVPFTAPLAPLTGMDLKDTILRVPIWLMLTRPRFLNRGSSDHNFLRMKMKMPEGED